jgi:hypothetical protein
MYGMFSSGRSAGILPAFLNLRFAAGLAFLFVAKRKTKEPAGSRRYERMVVLGEGWRVSVGQASACPLAITDSDVVQKPRSEGLRRNEGAQARVPVPQKGEYAGYCLS